MSKLDAAAALLNATTVVSTAPVSTAPVGTALDWTPICGVFTKAGLPCRVSTANGRSCIVHNRTVKPEAPVQPEAPATTEIVIEGYAMTIEDGTPDGAIIKAAILRNTANPWYAVALDMASKSARVRRIVRQDGVKGTPLARINAAIARGNKIRMDASMRSVPCPPEVANFHKLGIAQHATDKNVYLFCRMP